MRDNNNDIMQARCFKTIAYQIKEEQYLLKHTVPKVYFLA